MKQFNLITLLKLIMVLGVLSIGVACGPVATTPTPASEAPTGGLATTEVTTVAPDASLESYPPPPAGDIPAVEPYPGSGQMFIPPTFTPPSSYPPGPAAEETFQEPRFRFDQPVSVSAAAITGQAPPNTPLAVLDITYNGTLLGTGNSDDSGRFSIPVSGMIEGNRIGLMVGELAEGQTLEQMAEFYFPYRGEGFMNLPNLGIFFDTTIVTP